MHFHVDDILAMLVSEQCLIMYLFFLQLTLQLTAVVTPQVMKGPVSIHAHLPHVSCM